MSKRYFLSGLILIATAVIECFGQLPETDELVRAFENFRSHYFQEKIYVHADRSFYISGETIWFSIYNVDATLHRPATLSKVAYLDILDANNISILQAKVDLKNGKGSGSLFIPASIPSGNYKVRCYTQWMRNFSPEFFFHRTISIVNPFVSPEPTREIKAGKPIVVDFFPEGGQLVQGLRSVVAFKATGENGKGVDCTGEVLTDHDESIAKFSSGVMGIGRFTFRPAPGVRYKVKLTDKDNHTTFHSLPDAHPFGYVMNVKDSTERYLRVEVKQRWKNAPSSYVYLFAHSRQMIAHAEALPGHNGPAIFHIDKSKLREGISHITIFDEHLNPVCERLFFKYPQPLPIQIQTDQQLYGMRRKVQVRLTAPGVNPVSAFTSVSVSKIDSLPSPDNTDITNFLWLTADLQGKIESPEFYFSDAPERTKAVDNLMLTHGWRRFKWEQVQKNEFRPQLPPEYRGHIIRAKIQDQQGNPVSGLMSFLSYPGKIIHLYPARSQKAGIVSFEVLHFRGHQEIIVQTPSDSTCRIQIENPFSPTFGTYQSEPLKLEASMEKSLTDRTVGMQVQDIFFENNREPYRKTIADSIPFYGQADEIYLLDDYTRFPVMEEVMREYVPGVLVRKRRDGFHFIVLDAVHKTTMKEGPLILLDGIPVTSADQIMKFDPRKIRKLEVVTRPYYLGPATFPGIVSYSTYEGDLAGFEIDPRAVRMDYEGLQLLREFYSPRYENQKQRLSRIPDQRSLLYWNPELITGDKGETEFEFFTSDQQGTFLIRAEGINADGQAGTGSSIFTVKSFDH